MRTLSRFRILFLTTVFLAATVDPLLAHAQVPNLVQVENSQTGTTDWMPGATIADDVNNQIKAYASATSVGIGSSINLYVTVNPAQAFTINAYPIACYHGLGGRPLATTRPPPATPHPPPAPH